jgi:hypothetical protein
VGFGFIAVKWFLKNDEWFILHFSKCLFDD